ncbi:MAG: 50S ribosomal protein L24 [Thermodesulfobacteriota bacterium]
MVKYKVKKGDQVMIIAGRERGKTGDISRVEPGKGRVYVEKLNLVKRHQKPSAKFKHGGIIEKEAPIHISNVMVLCAKCKGPVRVGRKVLEDGTRVRFCKKCNEVLDK